ncbi:MAG: hypothetical protein J7559_18730 [Cohnella sp.]|nr:hypothetical protein [Cohnella sp.]
MDNLDIVTLAAIVAAYVGVVKSLGVPAKYSPLVAVLIAAALVLAPDAVQHTLTTISIIGLTAAGVYSQAKNKGGPGDGKGL